MDPGLAATPVDFEAGAGTRERFSKFNGVAKYLSDFWSNLHLWQRFKTALDDD